MTNDLTTTTTGSQLSILNDRLTEATELVKTASDDAIKAKLLSLKKSGLEWPPGVEAANAPAIYAFALKRCSLYALKTAAERIIQGEEGVTRYIPTPPALAALVRKIAAPLYSDLARIRETIQTIEEGKRLAAPPDDRDAEKARMRARLAEFREGVARVRKEMDPIPLRTEAELNKLFRNKQVETPAEPAAAGFDDREWNRRYDEQEAANARDDQ